MSTMAKNIITALVNYGFINEDGGVDSDADIESIIDEVLGLEDDSLEIIDNGALHFERKEQ